MKTIKRLISNGPDASDAGQQQKAADELAIVAGLPVYAASISVGGGKLLTLGGKGNDKQLLVVSEPGLELTTIDVTHDAADLLRRTLPWTAPRLVGLKCSVGLGDRLGLATPGHVRAVAGSGCMPFFPQQSIREMTRTERTPEQVMDDATWGVFQAGWRDGFGSDADHLKTTADIDACDAVGFTMYTIDPGDHVCSEADVMDASALASAWDAVRFANLETSPNDLRKRYVGQSFALDGGETLTLDDQTVTRTIVKYGDAIAHTLAMFRHLQDRREAGSFELEVSVDETDTPTTVAEHYLIAAELNRLGVRWVSLAPRFIGEFEKGIDYKGDLSAFEKSFARHVAVARTLGPYKLSIHSGSDKFAVYPIAAKCAGELIHLKTAGTSYLEALRVVARKRPELFRPILDFAFERFDEDRATYHISARMEVVPRAETLTDDQLEHVLNINDGRQLLHVTYGSVLTARGADGSTRFRDDLMAVLNEHEEEHYTVLAEHLGRHVRPFAQ